MPQRRVSRLTDGKDPEPKAALVAACVLEARCADEVASWHAQSETVGNITTVLTESSWNSRGSVALSRGSEQLWATVNLKVLAPFVSRPVLEPVNISWRN